MRDKKDNRKFRAGIDVTSHVSFLLEAMSRDVFCLNGMKMRDGRSIMSGMKKMDSLNLYRW